jgi:hypothetical protein
MSITFYITEVNAAGQMVRAYRCDCSQRWCDACDAAWANDQKTPEMFSCSDCTDTEVNMGNGNALEFMEWISIRADYGGDIPAPELAARCRRRLWDESRNHDPALSGEDRAAAMGVAGNPRVIVGDRMPGYLRMRTEQMLRICEKAGNRHISWG